jgi:hypothetical protein
LKEIKTEKKKNQQKTNEKKKRAKEKKKVKGMLLPLVCVRARASARAISQAAACDI